MYTLLDNVYITVTSVNRGLRSAAGNPGLPPSSHQTVRSQVLLNCSCRRPSCTEGGQPDAIMEAWSPDDFSLKAFELAPNCR